jgi:hypothetical protein
MVLKERLLLVCKQFFFINKRIGNIDQKIDRISATFDTFDDFKPAIFGLPAYPK